MCKHRQTKDTGVSNHDGQVPQKVTDRKRLNESRRANVTPDSLFMSHGLAFFVVEDGPKRQYADHDALNHRHAMHVPPEGAISR